MKPRKSGIGLPRKLMPSLRFSPLSLGHSSPQHCPPQCQCTENGNPLGAPLSIREVALIIGCSPWTVRQGYIPAGLPHHRLTPNGKLIFYKNQIIRWLLAHQQKGGTLS
jgi:hypothetical protein